MRLGSLGVLDIQASSDNAVSGNSLVVSYVLSPQLSGMKFSKAPSPR